jgi:tetratricopeptide (TPR) repeat protein
MLGTYGMRPAPEMYRGFLEAHQQAVRLCGWTPELRGDRAHGLHIFEHRYAEAEMELLQALREKPKWGPTYVRLAMLYAGLGRLDEALAFVEKARTVDSLFPPLPSTEVFVRFFRRELDAALTCAKAAFDLHPYLPLSRVQYAQALEYAGRPNEALEHYRIGCVIAPDLLWLPALEAVCMTKTGRRSEAATVLEELLSRRSTEYVDSYFVAQLLDALGRRDDAIAELERAVDERSAALCLMDVDPRLDSLRGDGRFARLRRHVLGDASCVGAASPS